MTGNNVKKASPARTGTNRRGGKGAGPEAQSSLISSSGWRTFTLKSRRQRQTTSPARAVPKRFAPSRPGPKWNWPSPPGPHPHPCPHEDIWVAPNKISRKRAVVAWDPGVLVHCVDSGDPRRCSGWRPLTQSHHQGHLNFTRTAIGSTRWAAWRTGWAERTCCAIAPSHQLQNTAKITTISSRTPPRLPPSEPSGPSLSTLSPSRIS